MQSNPHQRAAAVVIGLGLMGCDIAAIFLAGGYKVTAVEPSGERWPAQCERVRRSLEQIGGDLSGSSGKSRGYWRASDAGLAAWTVSAAMSPAEGVTMGVPVDSCLRNRIGDILPSLEALPGQRQ